MPQRKLSKAMSARITTLKGSKDEIIELKISNTDRAAYFTLDNTGETVRIRLSMQTALALAQMIDDNFFARWGGETENGRQ